MWNVYIVLLLKINIILLFSPKTTASVYKLISILFSYFRLNTINYAVKSSSSAKKYRNNHEEYKKREAVRKKKSRLARKVSGIQSTEKEKELNRIRVQRYREKQKVTVSVNDETVPYKTKSAASRAVNRQVHIQ